MFLWYGFASGCSYISTGLFLQLPKLLSKRNSYFVNRVSSTTHSSYDICFISYLTLLMLNFSWWASKMWRVRHVVLSTCLTSHISLFQNLLIIIQSYHVVKFLFVASFIETLQPYYVPPFSLLVFLEEYQSIFNSEKKLCPNIYLIMT